MQRLLNKLECWMNKSHIISKYSKERELLFHLPSYSFDELLLRIIDVFTNLSSLYVPFLTEA